MSVAPVLVVNSDPDARGRLHALLTEAGYAVVVCESAAAALQHIAVGTHYAVMVTDYMLEDLSGAALMEACAKAGVQVPTVMTAGRGEIGAAVRALRAGVRDFLPEPYDARIVRAVAQAAGPQATAP